MAPRALASNAARTMTMLPRLFRKRSTAATIDLASPAIARDPFPHYEELRRAGSVQYLPRHDAWIILGYDHVQSAFAQPQLFSNHPYAHVDAVLLAADPPEHADVRRVVSRLFSAETIERLAAFAERHAQSLLTPAMDVVSGYAFPLTAAVAGQLLGFTEAGLSRIRAARGNFPIAMNFDPIVLAIDSAAEGSAIYERLLADGVGEPQVRSLMRLLWLAAIATTERAIAHGVLRLLRHDHARNPALVVPFVEEVLRLHPPELVVPRLTTEPVVIGGSTIPAGANVYLCIAAANRDPSKFEAPSELRLDRPPSRILTFGSGIHHCVGAVLGRRVVQAAVRTLLVRAPKFRAAQPLGKLVGWCSVTASPIDRLLIEGVE